MLVDRLGFKRMSVVADLTIALFFWVLALSPPVWFLLAASADRPGSQADQPVARDHVRHERTPHKLRGRIFSAFSAITQAVEPLGILAFGWLIEVIGLSATTVIAAGASSVIVLSMAALPVLREMDRRFPS